jgi:hypothetical protein
MQSTCFQPGYNPSSNANSHFTVQTQINSTQYFASFVLQEIGTDTDPKNSIANSVIAVPVYLQESATALYTPEDVSGLNIKATFVGTPYILYHSSIADVTLNTPTNPSSSVYNIFMNMSLFDSRSGTPPGTTVSEGTTVIYPSFYYYQGATTTNLCDVLLTLTAQGKDMETAVFSLSGQQISANNPNGPLGGTGTNSNTFSSNPGQNLLTLNLPISSIFPQISTPGITFRIKTEIIGYV